MKYTRIFAMLLASAALVSACNDDELAPGNPVMNITGNLSSACFGDSLRFTVNASDQEVPLSTIHAELYFGDEMVSEEVIRTKESGKDYEAVVGVPYLANIPDGKATLRLTLQNIHFTTTEQIYEVSLTHPAYPELTFVAEDGTEYKMQKDSEDYVYSMTQRFPAELKGKIVAPAMGEFGNEITFGYENSEIKPGADGLIPFSNSAPGRYTVSFNTFSFEGSPFVVLSLNGQQMESTGETTSELQMTLAKGDIITPAGFPNFSDWFINPDFFTKNPDGTLTFNAYNGSYAITADTGKLMLGAYKLNGSEKATLNEDGTGAVWILGEGVGFPSISSQPGWNPGQGICMAPVGEKTYQLTVVGGKTLNIESVNFKFFGQDGWGTELSGDMLTSKSDIIGVGDGKKVEEGGNGHDSGNLYLLEGATIQDNGVYVFTLDLTQGINDAILTSKFAGEQQFEEKPVYLNEKKMVTNDNQVYSLVTDLKPGDKLTFREFSAIYELYYDPDFFRFDESAGTITFLPIAGHYNVVLNKLDNTLSARMVNADGSEMTLQADGSGALWLMAWGLGSPDQDHQFGFNPGAAYSMAQVAPGVYQFTGKAGPEKDSVRGDRYRYDYLSVKFFHQNGWGGEFGAGALKMAGSTASLLKNTGNFDLADGVTLELGATYRMTVDLSKGIENGTIDLVKL